MCDVQMLWDLAQREPEKLTKMFGVPAEAIIDELKGEMAKLQAATALQQQAEK
jgi:uncharacterized protein YcgL (UPF0745 family)